MRKAFLPLFLIVVILSACSYSTANITDTKMCTEVQELECATDTTAFSTDAEALYISAILNNAPEDTKITFRWIYLGYEDGPFEIDTVELVSKDVTTIMNSSLSKPDNGWPTGPYKVVIELESDNSVPVEKEFTISE